MSRSSDKNQPGAETPHASGLPASGPDTPEPDTLDQSGPDSGTDKIIALKGQITITLADADTAVTIETPGGRIVVKGDKDSSISITDAQKNNIKLSSNGIALTSTRNITMKALGAVNIQGSTINLKSQNDLMMEGMNIGAVSQVGIALTSSATATLKASAQVTIQGTMVMIN